MRILVTGHQGYIGQVLTRTAKLAGLDVVGCDAGFFHGCRFGRLCDDIPAFNDDVRDLNLADLASFDAIVHLAGLVGDWSDGDAATVHEINCLSAIQLAQSAKAAGVTRFVYASSCAVYGDQDSLICDERSAPRPLSPYAQSKLEAEQAILQLRDRRFSPISLRLATVYGVSPMLRLDLVVNDFCAAAFSTGRITLKDSGISWRPFVHVEDVARAILATICVDDERHIEPVYNLVPIGGNHRVTQVAELVAERIPGTTWAPDPNRRDARSYRADGTQFLQSFPDFRFRWDLKQGIDQLRNAFAALGLTPSDVRGTRYRRMARLESLFEQGVLNRSLRKQPVCQRRVASVVAPGVVMGI